MRMTLWGGLEHFWKPRDKCCALLVGCIWGENIAHAEGSCSLAALLPLTKDSPGCTRSPHQHPAPPKSGPFETEVTRGGLSAAALISIPYTTSHLALVPWEGHHGEENSLSVLRAGMHQGGDTDADILVSDFLAPHGTAAFALGNTGQPP